MDEYQRILHSLRLFEKDRQLILAEAKKQYSEMGEEIQVEAANALRALEGEEQRYLASLMYWQLDGIVKTPTIREAIGHTSGAFYKWVIPAHVSTECRTCGKTFDTPIQSRSSSGVSSQCPECEALRFEELKKRQQEERAQHVDERDDLRSMPYAEYLKTDHWQTVRLGALKRAQFRCQVCNAKDKPLHVHHRTYKNRGHEEWRDLLVLCEDCHKMFHESGKLDYS